MNDRIKFYLQSAFENRSGGSGEVLDQLMQGIVKATEEGYTWNEERLKEVIRKSLNQLGHFAIVVHFLDHVLRSVNKEPSGKAVVELIQDYRKNWSSISTAHARNLRSVQTVANQTILVHSHSSSIVGLFKVLSEQTDLSETTIIQSISHPGREGLIQGERLASQGWKVRMIEDAAMGKLLTQCDYVILGSDVITETTFVNKIGSMSIVAAAKLLHVPVYVLGDERKLIDDQTLPEKLSARLFNEEPKPDGELNLKPGQTGINYYFEHIPCDWVNGFVLSGSIYTLRNLSEMIHRHAYSAKLLVLAE